MTNFFKTYVKAGNTVLNNLLIANYRRLNMTNQEFLVFIQVKSFIDNGQDFPDIQQIAQHMGESEQAIYQLLHELIKKKLLTIDSLKGADGLTHDVYDFSLLYEKLAVLEEQSTEKVQVETQQTTRRQLFAQFESEFGRTLSPIELETIGNWIDEDRYQPALIQLALKEAVLNQVYNFKYIDKILMNWEKRNIRTPEEVQKYRNAHSTGKVETKVNKGSQPKIPIFKITDQNPNH